MFFTYLRRELRRRMRQAVFIAMGLALGIGLVITVNAASSGVKAAQGTVLQNLYGVGTSATVTMPPSAGSFGLGGRNFTFKPGATIKIEALTAANVDTTFKIPNFSAGGGFPSGGTRSGDGQFRGPGSFNAGNQVTVNGVDLSAGGQPLGPLSNGTLSSGRTFKASDASSDVAMVDASYAKSASLKVGSDVTIANTKFPLVGIVTDPAADSSADIYIPLARAQALANPAMKGKVNTIYVAAANSADIATVQ